MHIVRLQTVQMKELAISAIGATGNVAKKIFFIRRHFCDSLDRVENITFIIFMQWLQLLWFCWFSCNIFPLFNFFLIHSLLFPLYFFTASAAKEAMLPYFPQIVEFIKVIIVTRAIWCLQQIKRFNFYLFIIIYFCFKIEYFGVFFGRNI